MASNGKAKTEAQMLREQKRIEKEKEKASRQAQAAVAKGMRKENWMEYMTILVDNKIASGTGGTELLTALELENMKCEVVCQPLPNTISFDRRELIATNGTIVKTKIHEEEVLLVEQAEVIAEHIRAGTLLEHVSRCCSIMSEEVKSTVTLFIMGLDRVMKKKKGTIVNRADWEAGLIDLQLKRNITSYCIKNNAELTDNIRMFCKALGERPHKLRANKDLFVGAHKDSLFVDKDGRGYLQVWIAQLQEIRSINEAIASAVAQIYPSPQSFCNFIRDTDRQRAVDILADIQVRRGVGVLANVRRVGPEAAKRLVQFFSSTDPNEGIS